MAVLLPLAVPLTTGHYALALNVLLVGGVLLGSVMQMDLHEGAGALRNRRTMNMLDPLASA